MKSTYKFSDMVQHIFNSEYVTWWGIDNYSDVPYINNYPNLHNNPYHRTTMDLFVNHTNSYVDRESVHLIADLNMIMESLSEMLPEQELVFPIYSGCNFDKEFRYKYTNGVFVLTKIICAESF